MTAYVDYAYYSSIYGDTAIPEADFDRLSWDACRDVDMATTGVDHVMKLKTAFPSDEYSVEAVKRCVCEVINTLYQINRALQSEIDASGYVQREDGTYHVRTVSSVSAGNESISYASGAGASTLYIRAASDDQVKRQIIRDVICRYLSGIADANGVNLLYMGKYPCRLEER
jgi:hypothetical protein